MPRGLPLNNASIAPFATAFCHPTVEVRFVISILLNLVGSYGATWGVADGAVVPEIVFVVRAYVAPKKIRFWSAVINTRAQVKEHEKALLEQRSEGLAIGIQHQVRAGSNQVRSEIETSVPIVQLIAFQTVRGCRFIVPDAEPTDPTFHGDRTGNVPLRVVEEVAKGEVQSRARTVPLHLAIPITQVSVVLRNASRNPDLQIALGGCGYSYREQAAKKE